jgi:hypothetical protein
VKISELGSEFDGHCMRELLESDRGSSELLEIQKRIKILSNIDTRDIEHREDFEVLFNLAADYLVNAGRIDMPKGGRLMFDKDEAELPSVKLPS